MNSKIYFFWIAEYNDGNCLPQFDPNTGNENLFKEVNQSKLIRFGWYPFTLELSQKVPESEYNPLLPKYVINLKPNDKLFAKRRNHIQRVGKFEKRFTEYCLGNQDFIMIIKENGDCEI